MRTDFFEQVIKWPNLYVVVVFCCLLIFLRNEFEKSSSREHGILIWQSISYHRLTDNAFEFIETDYRPEAN